MVDQPYQGSLPLLALNQQLAASGFEACQPLLISQIEQFLESKLIAPNPITEQIIQNLEEISTVADMAAIAGLSPRQLQRTLKQSVGFTPHDFLKILRVQEALIGKDPVAYADQSHFIHSFRKATGYTPGRYTKKFDV